MVGVTVMMLKGMNCLITGASRGLGKHLAEAFWDAGANLLLISRSKESMANTISNLPNRENQIVVTLEADLSDPTAPDKMIAEARLHFRTLDVIVNNAGVQGPIGAVWTNDWTEWQSTLQVNLFSPILLCRLSVPWMAKNGKGKIINISGGGAAGPRANFTAYATSKAGLVRFSETLAQEVQELGIDVNCIAPGAMDTAMLGEVVKAGASASGLKEYELALKARQGGGTLPNRPAALSVFLASSASDGITGKLISAVWDPWKTFLENLGDLQKTDIYTLRRIVPEDRSIVWERSSESSDIPRNHGGRGMKICVLGLWHLGTVTAACLASQGHSVVGLDFDEETIRQLQAGCPPLFEPGLEALIQDGLKDRYLSFTSDLSTALKDAEIIWVTYDTPVDEDDQADVAFVTERVERLFPLIPERAVVLISSQVPVGTTRRLEQTYAKAFPNKPISFAYSPENLRLGKAISVFTQPDRVVIGIRSQSDKELLSALLRPFTERIEWMSVESGEMTKHALNAFLATSVVFINEIATICEEVGADVKEVECGLKTEERIGPKAYLSPGAAFAGGTLARDIAFLKKLGAEHGQHIPMLSNVQVSNEMHKQWVSRKLLSLLGDLNGRHVAIWGLTYKPGTDTLRRSTAIETCRWLVEQGAHVQAHDPVVKALPKDLAQNVTLCDDAIEALSGAEALVVATEWPEYRAMRADMFYRMGSALFILDPNRFLAKTLGNDPNLHYVTVGGIPLNEKEVLV